MQASNQHTGKAICFEGKVRERNHLRVRDLTAVGRHSPGDCLAATFKRHTTN